MTLALARFPRRTLRATRVVHRIHLSVRGPWWFSADGSGRFDPVGTALGACYVAEHPLGAWVEVVRKQLLLAEADLLHLVRHDPAQQLYAMALFAPAGAPDSADGDWPRQEDGPIPEALVADAVKRFGYRVLPDP